MRVVLFTIGNYEVHSYGVVVALAVLLALGVARYLAEGTLYKEHIGNMLPYVIAGAILCARIWHVFFFQWGYYSEHPIEILYIGQGGIAIQGALIGGFAAALFYTRKHRLSFWKLADLLAPAIVLGQSIGRIACFLNGDAYGSPTGLGFGLVYPEGSMAHDVYGSQPLWPAEVWEGQWDLIVFVILILLRNKKWPSGVLFLIYNIMYSFGRFNLEWLRGDSPRYAFHWTAGQWTSFSVIAASLCLIVFLVQRDHKKLNEVPVSP
ncbi:prolipoprotein diacylglyceryl transferase [Paenibacillus radicis (ex Gao et al. 2016)]|uniref:Phosphatidylglycerol--prolipoprotein diacylglyceryl transferase n=1 Tax=Paenibacillus radicis (ex Gao et al. 2016) TaxID=1737354 RepID=A0A917H1J5_9BACL|nr:prolipoprotein diacylglyceryl transferase [Paenibacillus radicis (ex Gao et al. 2016)]GGG64623.1 prolipoprotein diacylglyceryl transferase [Paenibacillus radicis (ex Gao et al. 2016)]